MVTRSWGSDTRFFKDLISEFIGPNESCDGDADDLRDHLVRWFLTQCATNEESRVVFFLDEIHRMTEKEWSFLIDLTNKLDRHGIDCIVISCGQPEILDRRKALVKGKRNDVVGRYLVEPFEFTGVVESGSLAEILVKFDTPEGVLFTGKQAYSCVTEAYLPARFQSGFRIHKSSHALWAAMVAASKTLNLTPNVGLQLLTRIVETALLELVAPAPNSAPDIESEGWWASILTSCGYLEAVSRNRTASPSKTRKSEE